MNQFTTPEDFVIHVIERHMEKIVNLKAAPIIVAGGYGVGSKENFQLLHELATVLGGEVRSLRARRCRFLTNTSVRSAKPRGTTVRPKLYIACGISGQIQHTGMEESAMVIAINTDSNAPIKLNC